MPTVAYISWLYLGYIKLVFNNVYKYFVCFVFSLFVLVLVTVYVFRYCAIFLVIGFVDIFLLIMFAIANMGVSFLLYFFSLKVIYI